MSHDYSGVNLRFTHDDYPSNGRALTDDAGGFFIREMSNGKLADDGLRPRTDLLAELPYEGPPHDL